MCGIVCAFDLKEPAERLRPQILQMAGKIRHRGPDWNGIFSNEKAILAHERLAVVDPISGKQPLVSPDGRFVLSINGSIFNHQDFRTELEKDYSFKTKSDCEVIIPLFQKYGPEFMDKINGVFGFALYDVDQDRYFIARDHLGIIPLYMGWDKAGTFYIASELKALEPHCSKIELFPPGHYLDSREGEIKKWYERDWMDYENIGKNPPDISELREALEKAVHRQLMTDVPYAVLLSGGLDSSIISAVVKKYSEKRIESGDKEKAWYPQLHSFATGLEGSPDLAAARKVAEHIGTIHHEVIFTIQEGIDAIRDVIYYLESYDITTIRSSTPMYLMARAIKAMGIKVVLSGEGSDEIFGGYLYFHKAPDAEEFHKETVRKLDLLHMYDCLRVNKSLASWGIEGRVPFLDKEFLDFAMRLNPKDKMSSKERIEKWVLRKAFDSYLPESIAWRQKEQFSDGVGYSWIDTLKQLAEEKVSDTEFANAKDYFPINTPTNKEEFMYRMIFTEHFPSDEAARSVPSLPSVACSSPAALEWDESFKNMNEPSGRAVKTVHAYSS